jgi:hypothetical protein
MAATPCVPPASVGSRTSRPGRRPYGAARLTRRGAPIAAGKDDARAASEPGLRHAACHRTNRRFRVVGTRHPVAIGERVHEPAGRRAGVPGREQPEAEIPHATFGCAPLDRPPLCPCRRGENYPRSMSGLADICCAGLLWHGSWLRSVPHAMVRRVCPRFVRSPRPSLRCRGEQHWSLGPRRRSASRLGRPARRATRPAGG